MPLPDSLILASEVIGFLSFGFTLLTALGVYADLIKTLKSAPSTIPISLGNLREEIRYEQLLCKRTISVQDPYHVLPVQSAHGKKKQRDAARLLAGTLRHLWMEFCDVERNFLVDGETQSTGSDGDDSHEDEKNTVHRRRRRSRPDLSKRQSFVKGRMGWIEAGLARDQQTYYNTDLSHRFAWWWRKDDVDNLAQQLQRIQIRRIERDAYETNELVKRGLQIYGEIAGVDVHDDSDDSDDHGNRGGGGGGGSDSDDDGGGGGRRGLTGAVNTHPHRRRHRRTSTSHPASHRRSRNGSTPHGGGGIREVSEKGTVRRRAPSPIARQPSRLRRSVSVASARPTRPARGSVVYEYEIVDPGGVHVEYESPRQEQRWREGRQRSFSRQRDGSRM